MSRIEEAGPLRYFLVAGYGYPSYLGRIASAAADLAMAGSLFSHLLVCVDAEEDGHDARLAEVEAAIVAARCPVPFTVVVADCCIEAWLLGNRKFVRRNPHDVELRGFLQHYDVIEEDPEGMLPLSTHRTRAALCLDYLRAVFRERNQRYSKLSPGPAATEPYFNALCERARPRPEGPGHLRSFARLLELRDQVKHEREE